MHNTKIIFHNNATKIIELDVPKPSQNKILIKTHLTHINARNKVNKLKHSGTKPLRPGYTTIKTIIEVGPEVSGYQVGDRVLTIQKHTSHTISEPLDPIP